ncbi:MAG: hypothetical protein LBG24_09995 [Treponema sp.]|nr:hypothetical protein [Treponema sp.]
MYVEQMLGASSAAARKAVVAALCRQFACSTAKAYKVLKENSRESGRAKRKDAGTTSLDETLLLAVAAMGKLGVRKNGKTTVPVTVIRSILQSRGLDIAVGDSRLRELLRIVRYPRPINPCGASIRTRYIVWIPRLPCCTMRRGVSRKSSVMMRSTKTSIF